MPNPLARIPVPAPDDPFPEPVDAFARVAERRGVTAPPVRRPALRVVTEPVPAEVPAHRPVTFAEIVGQQRLLMRLQTHLRAAVARGDQPGHVLLTGGAGLGKTTLAMAFAGELGAGFHELTADVITNPRKLAVELAKLAAGDVLFVDELQGLPAKVQTSLLRVLEDSIMYVDGSAKAPAIRFDVPEFTLVAATDRPGKLSNPLRDRFKLTAHLEPYDVDDLALVAMQYAERADVKLDVDAAMVLGAAARGVPRRVVRLVDAARDYSFEVTGQLDELVDDECARQSLEYGGTDELGLEDRDHRYLECLVRDYMGGPVGAPVLAGTLGWDQSELTADVEPFLMASGLLSRRSNGRCATAETYRAVGLPVPPIVNGWLR
jgi:Holliday junction DNA helicase RuvB